MFLFPLPTFFSWSAPCRAGLCGAGWQNQWFGPKGRWGMWAWRCVIVAVSLAQVAAGVACWCLASDGDGAVEVGRFGLAACLAVGVLGLVGQGSTFLRTAAIAANALLAAVFVPGLLGRVVIRVVVWTGATLPAGIDTGVMTDL